VGRDLSLKRDAMAIASVDRLEQDRRIINRNY
jgi:hypothetical protein